MFDRIEKGLYWDRLWRLVDGCAPCSPGCERCWSARYTHRFDARYVGQPPGDVDAYEHAFTDGSRFNGIVRLRHDKLELPLRTKKPQAWLILNDLFHEDVPREFIAKSLDLAFHGYINRGHIFLFLTKRIKRMFQEFTLWAHLRGNDLAGIEGFWPGVSVCNDSELWKIGDLLQIHAAVRWVSIEPMLGEIDIYSHLTPCGVRGVDWVVLGAETGPGARPMMQYWAKSIVDQCKCAGVPVFIKQIHIPIVTGQHLHTRKTTYRISKNMNEWPENLRVRELPEIHN